MARRPLKPSVIFNYDENRIAEYFNSLVIEEDDDISNERIKQIVSVARIHLESNNCEWSISSIKEKFYSVTTKIMNSKDDAFYYGNVICKEKFTPLIFESDLEKVLLIISYCDPNNLLLKNWNELNTSFLQDENSALSASNYFKAKNIMKMYFDGFFNIKLILDEQKVNILMKKIVDLTPQKK